MNKRKDWHKSYYMEEGVIKSLTVDKLFKERIIKWASYTSLVLTYSLIIIAMILSYKGKVSLEKVIDWRC